MIASETGSGKTLSFLLPCLANLTYPPDMYLDEMKVGGHVCTAHDA